MRPSAGLSATRSELTPGARTAVLVRSERGNCNMVSKLGVTVIYTPDGVTAKDWENALRVWPQPGKIVSA